MRSIETSGKTVEDAVKTGLQELRLTSSDVTIDVIDMGSPGLFGMFGRLAKVRLTVKEKDEALDFQMPVMSLDNQPTKQQKPKQEKKPEPKRADNAPKPERPAEKPRVNATPAKPEAPKPAQTAPAKAAANPPASGDNVRREERRERAPRPKTPKPPRPEPLKEAEDLPPLNLDALSEKGRMAYDFLSNVTTLMGVNVEIRILESEDVLSVQMMGDTLGILIGRRGETLDSLQYLTSLQINKDRDEYTRVTLDTEHYRAKREEALEKLATRMAGRVRRTGHKMALEPMNPYERRILHSALQNHPYVTTHSEGDEPYRRVIITLK